MLIVAARCSITGKADYLTQFLHRMIADQSLFLQRMLIVINIIEIKRQKSMNQPRKQIWRYLVGSTFKPLSA